MLNRLLNRVLRAIVGLAILCLLLTAACATNSSPAPDTAAATLAASRTLPITPTVSSATASIPSPTTPPPVTRAPSLPQTGFRLLAHHDLGQQRANGGLAIAAHCAYIGNRAGSAVAILDIADPLHPQLASQLTIPGTASAIEVRAARDRSLLVVASTNGLHLFDIRDCLHPLPTGELSLPSAPHEFYLWRDPARPTRLLAYVAMFSSANGLHVVDLSDPAHPSLALTWSVPALPGLLHSLSLSPDGRRAFISYWSGGLLIADTSELAAALPHPQIRLLGKLAYAAMSTHSTVPLPGRPLVLLTDEIYSCPFGWLHLVDAFEPAQPRIVGEFRLPENRASPCAEGTWTAHNPLPLGDLALVTWYDGGLLALDLADSAHPRLAAQFRVAGERFWSYPIVRDGLIYVVSIEGGLYVLAYDGPHADTVHAMQFAEGNAN